MPTSSFSHVNVWVFDLDNTLYPPRARLFDQIEVRMTKYVMSALNVDEATANTLRLEYWQRYGTTLAGLMREHDVDPGPYLTDVHDISLDHLEQDPLLADAIANLPGRKIVYTNGCAPYAERVIAARGLAGQFDAVYGVEHAGFLPKPELAAFQTVFSLDGLSADRAAMFEDDARNLIAPFDMGVKTVHVAETSIKEPHIEFYTDDLASFLRRLHT
ncbi:MAG: pyrimidine 5'-nucleotidase [Paracoccaceae bacterium]